MNEVCCIEGCARPARTRGMCKAHYNRWLADGGTGKVCTVSGCSNAHYGKGLCRTHYMEEHNRAKPECSIEGCVNRAVTAGLCNAHYLSRRRFDDPLAVEKKRIERSERICSIDGCSNPVKALGYCNSHYLSWSRHGDPLTAKQIGLIPSGSPCLFEACDLPSTVMGFCQKHYTKALRDSKPGWSANLCMAYRMRKQDAFVQDIDRWLVFDVYQGACYLCGEEIDPNSEWDIEHIQPISRGGLHAYHNVAPAHGPCNYRKWCKTLIEFFPSRGVDV